MNELLDPEDCTSFLSNLGCAKDGEAQDYPYGFGQKWITANGSPFFIQHHQETGKVLGVPFTRILNQLMSQNGGGRA